jgi:hypothetical protein
VNQPIQKVRGSRSTSRSILKLFTLTVPRIKSKGLLIDVSFNPYTFYTCNVTYKKQGAPDQCLILSLYFLHMQHHVQKARDSRSTSHSILIFFSRAVPHTKSYGLPIDAAFYLYTFCMHSDRSSQSMIIVLFRHDRRRGMKSKGHIYIHHTTHLRHPINSFQHKFDINEVLLQNTKKKLHHDL